MTILVHSLTDETTEYAVDLDGDIPACGCPANQRRRLKCTHIKIAELATKAQASCKALHGRDEGLCLQCTTNLIGLSVKHARTLTGNR